MTEDEESRREDEEYIANVLDRIERWEGVRKLAIVIGCAVSTFGAMFYFVNRHYFEGALCTGFAIFLIFIWFYMLKEYERLRSARRGVGL